MTVTVEVQSMRVSSDYDEASGHLGTACVGRREAAWACGSGSVERGERCRPDEAIHNQARPSLEAADSRFTKGS
jgi:hypothetical protein